MTTANQTIHQNGVLGPLSFSVSDAETPAANLLLSGASSNSSLVPTNGFVFAGTGGSRSVSITPATNQSGDTQITLSVVDAAGATNSTSFLLSVRAVNHPPQWVATSNQTNYELTSITITNRATDPDSPAQILTFSYLSGPTNATLDSTTGVFNWTPSEIQGPSTNAIVIAVSDNGSPPMSSTQTFAIVVAEVNLPPILNSVPSFHIHAGTLVIFTFSASDPDFPTNTLAFHLVGGPPDASIDSNTGSFSWLAGNTTEKSTNGFTVIVQDNGVPPLMTTNLFLVIVDPPPRIDSVEATSTGVTLSWSSIPQTSYEVRYKTNLEGSVWINLPGSVQATGNFSAKTDGTTPCDRRFYQIKVLP